MFHFIVYFMLMFVVLQRTSASSLPVNRQILRGDGSISSSRFSAGSGLFTASKQSHWPALFCPFLPLAFSLLRFRGFMLHGYLKTSNACEALTISGDCCWVISGKEVSLQFPCPPREHRRSHTFTQACTQPHLEQKHTCKHKHTDLLSSVL